MTDKEAIEQLEWVKKRISNITYSPESFEALNIAIEALKNKRDFEKEYMKHYEQGRKDERAIQNGELLQSCSELDMRGDMTNDR